MENPLSKFGSILWKKWEIAPNEPSKIVGYWNEDCTNYYMLVPSQLRDSLVTLQNNISDIYIAVENKKEELATSIYNIKKVFYKNG